MPRAKSNKTQNTTPDPLNGMNNIIQSYIDIGISINANVEACGMHRRRHHRNPIFNRVEMEIERYKATRVEEEDISLWKNKNGDYKKCFSSRDTWEVIREKHMSCYWYKAVWYKYATPKFSFILWTALNGKLPTGDRMIKWSGSIDTACVLCRNHPLETLQHLFFDCSFSTQVWEKLMKGVLGNIFTSNWGSILRIALDQSHRKIRLFVIRYVLQSAVHTIWRERNRRRHGEASSPVMLLIKQIDKNMRNKFSIIRKKGDEDFDQGLSYWFSTRP